MINSARNDIIASITRAKLELDGALEDVKSLPMVDPMTLGFITHALNNYLQVTHGTVGLLVDVLQDHPNDQVGIWLQGLQEVTKRMQNLVQEMRFGPGKSAPLMHLEKFDIVILIQRACDFYRRIAIRKQIDIVFDKPLPPLPKVRTDRLALAAILDNLLSNAVKFSPVGKRISVDLRHEGNRVVCRVRDQGPGISSQDQANLFQRGSQLKAKPTGGESSNGFGLAVAAELVANLGGEIGCESERGKGTCFFFRLPCPEIVQRPRPAK